MDFLNIFFDAVVNVTKSSPSRDVYVLDMMFILGQLYPHCSSSVYIFTRLLGPLWFINIYSVFLVPIYILFPMQCIMISVVVSCCCFLGLWVSWFSLIPTLCTIVLLTRLIHIYALHLPVLRLASRPPCLFPGVPSYGSVASTFRGCRRQRRAPHGLSSAR